jgi:DNA-binding NarL/FixJ family response regulator
LVRNAIKAGVRGYLLESDCERELLPAIEALAAHQPFFKDVLAQMILRQFPEGFIKKSSRDPTKQTLTAREREIVQLLSEGKTSREMSAALKISIKTTETHRRNIRRKLDAHHRADIVRYAVRNGLIEP